jgi:hypothetical protein
MPKPSVKFSDLRSTQPYWLGTKIVDPKITVPGGARINATGLPAQSDGRLYLPGGTALGRTAAERDAGTGYGLLVDGDTDVVILLHDIWDVRDDDYTDVLQPYAGNTVYRNFLPGWDSPSAIGITLTAAQKDLLQNGRYLCLKGLA